jgi:hypothetical protein
VKNLYDQAIAEMLPIVQTHGFCKVASAVHGVDFSNLKVALEHLGTQYFSRQYENRTMLEGLAAFAALTKE